MVPTGLYMTRWTKLQVSISCIWENKNVQTDYNNNVYEQLRVFTLSSQQTVVSKPELAWRQLGCRIEGLIHIQWKGTAGKRVNCCRIWRRTYGNYFRKGSLASVRVHLLSYFYADSSLSSRIRGNPKSQAREYFWKDEYPLNTLLFVLYQHVHSTVAELHSKFRLFLE